jgi:ribonuclease HI
MIQNNNSSNGQKNLVKPFRRTGPLDAYIYKERGHEENVEDIQNQVLVHLPPQQKILHVFTDGACTNNGQRGAKAAWGVLIVADQNYSIIDTDSGRIPPNEPQTNQRAELRALLRGLEIADNYILGNTGITEVQIWSDSQYAIKCTSEWGITWKNNGWTKKGGDIQHLDLVKPLVETYSRLFGKVRLKWLEGHATGAKQHQFPWMFNHRVDAVAVEALQHRGL